MTLGIALPAVAPVVSGPPSTSVAATTSTTPRPPDNGHHNGDGDSARDGDGDIARDSAGEEAALPPTTLVDNEFFPEDENVSDCISALPQPGCGSSARGGWRHVVVFAVMLGGMALIGLRIAWAIRRRDHNRVDAST